MIDISPLAGVTIRREVEVERGRIRFFCRTIGLDGPEYHDVAAARAQGYPDLVLPPTLLVGLELETRVTFDVFDRLNIPLQRVLHAGQRMSFGATLHAGDTLVFTTTVPDSYSKKGGALDFLVRRTDVSRDGAAVAQLESTIVVQNDREVPQ